MPHRVAYFVSSHGFGHASRACGVMEAVWRRSPDVRFELFTTTPAWFFELSLPRATGYHATVTDLGLVQTSALEEDLEETVRQLRDWLPFRPQRLDPLAAAVTGLGCELAICDISPIGLAVARRAGLPSLLVENFTWDWIYRGYREPALAAFADQLEEVFATAGHRIQTEPLCREVAGTQRVAPVRRAPRMARDDVRRRLGVPGDAALVMATMGGVEWDWTGIEARLATGATGGGRERWLMVPGAGREPRTFGRAVLLPHRSDFYHPDLIHAADAVIGKLGYSTVAEVYSAGLPFGYVPRPSFPESAPVEAWVQRHLPCRRIDAEAFVAWEWLDAVDPLLELPRNAPDPPDGGDDVAQTVLEMLA